MYVVYIKDHMHHLLNECKKLNFAYNSDQRVYYKENSLKTHRFGLFFITYFTLHLNYFI